MFRMVPIRVVLVLTLLALAAPALAEWDADGLEKLLPQALSEAERLALEQGTLTMPGGDLRSDPPPVGPVRNCAEWEPCTGVLIRYPLGLPYGLLQDLDDDVMLHVIVSSSYYNTAVTNLTNNGVDMAKVQFLIKPNDSIWTRDYGPWFVFDGSGDIAIIDHTYNRPRPNDNLIPIYFGEQQGIPVHSHDMYHTGGNYMTDGAHISSSTRLVYNEAASYNGMSQAQVDQLMADYYGVATYYVVDYIESGGIHHIDTMAKFLDEETVLVKEVWPSHGTYDELNQLAALYASLEASTGRNYQVHRVYCYSTSSGPASYTNSLILNDGVYVPFFGNSSYDNDAIAVYEEAMPGYTVRGYYYGSFLDDDALHCRAKGVMDAGMLRVAHTPIVGTQDGDVTVRAFVDDRSETGLTAVELHYRQDGGMWVTEAMTSIGGDVYEAVIYAPYPVGGRTDIPVDYYIHAEDASGRAEGMPRVEPAAWYSFIQHAPDTGAPAPDAGPVALHGNYPNPFNPKTTFSFELLYPDDARLAVYDAQGRLVKVLVDGLCAAGRTAVTWDGTDEAGAPVPAGVYFYRLRAAGLEYGRPAVLVK
ncbi:MAG: agmatine deiminase family protein [Candidatus Krumholzibacteriota bacterium]|nr:agmatine deiminase family protein [Candidatus Krumholzibacteriota bacterium]